MIKYKFVIFYIIFAIGSIDSNSQIELSSNKTNEALEVSPIEDLMREHGILNRILLIYEECIKRLAKEEEFPSGLLMQASGIIRDFIENYHEKLEEEFIFSRFEKAGEMTDLVRTLKEQHQKGRILTDYILQNAKELKNNSQKKEMQKALEEFINMYRPHEAREDTVLFPAFKTLVTQKEYDSLGEIFEDREQQLFGPDGFNKIVNEVASIEKALGIYNLSLFTPNL